VFGRRQYVSFFKPKIGVEAADFEANVSIFCDVGHDLGFSEIVSVNDDVFATQTVQSFVIHSLKRRGRNLLGAVDGLEVLAILCINLAIFHDKHRKVLPVFCPESPFCNEGSCSQMLTNVLTRAQASANKGAKFAVASKCRCICVNSTDRMLMGWRQVNQASQAVLIIMNYIVISGSYS
jgi:hypothetical protein